MKAGVGLILALAAELVERGVRPTTDLILVLTADEEEGYRGAAQVAESGEIADARELLILEPTGCIVYGGQKGELWLEATFTGEEAHGSVPQTGRSAITPAIRFVQADALRAAECGATAVRLDTPRSRRGNMRAIIEEVRWELDAHGYAAVKIFLSGGVTREDVIAYRDIVDAFGVGGAIANAPVIDFSMDIVEIDGKQKAKRGKRSGAKQVWEKVSGEHTTLPVSSKGPDNSVPLLSRFIENGKVVQKSGMEAARERLMGKMSLLTLETTIK